MPTESSPISGVRSSYGPLLSPSATPNPRATVESVAGNYRQLEIKFNYNGLPATNKRLSETYPIPVNAVITRASWQTLVPFAGGTSYNVGLYNYSGGAVSAAGIFSALALASIDTAGETNISAGALIGVAAGGTAPGSHVGVVATGTFTAGQARLVIEYLDPVG